MNTAILIAALTVGQVDPYAEAVRTNVPLVIGVGCAPPASGDYQWWLTAYRKSLDGYKAPCIVVCVKGAGNYLVWHATLPSWATAADVSKTFLVPRKYNPETTPNYQERMRRISRRPAFRAASC